MKKMYFTIINDEPTFKPLVVETKEEAIKQTKELMEEMIISLKEQKLETQAKLKQNKKGFDEAIGRQKKGLKLFDKPMTNKARGDELVKLELVGTSEFAEETTKEQVKESYDISCLTWKDFREAQDKAIDYLNKQIDKYSKGKIDFFVLEK